MNRKRPILLIILAAYIFAPGLLDWIGDPDGSWYRPFIIWALVVAVTFAIHSSRSADTE